MEYWCSQCGNRTEPRLYEPGAGASCCEEAPLMVMDYEARGPLQPSLRSIDEAEQRELTEELYQDEHADDTPAQRRHARWLEDS